MISKKIDANLLQKISVQENKSLDCIVQFNNLTDMRKYVMENNIERSNVFEFVKSVVVGTTMSRVCSLSYLESVKYISSVAGVETMINVAKDIIGLSDNNVEKATFSTVIIDTGLYPHLDFVLGQKVNVLEFVDIINGKNIIYDDNGHGTSVAGLLVGSGVVSDNKYAGIDTNTDILIIKALDKNGETNAINILKAMQWVYNNKDKYNIRIACMSFGSNVLEINDPLIAGAEALWDNGIVVVSACGNSGPESETIKSPSASKKIISVGALDDHRNNDTYSIANFEIAEFSSRGPILGNFKPDVVVSGVDVVSSCNYGIYKTFYRSMSGTSVATPIVAGIVSRVLKKNPTFTPDQVKQFLIAHTRRITNDRNSEGYGWIDLHDVNL